MKAKSPSTADGLFAFLMKYDCRLSEFLGSGNNASTFSVLDQIDLILSRLLIFVLQLVSR